MSDKAATDREGGRSDGNDADRVEWFRDAGFGLFIHFGISQQLGAGTWPLSESDDHFTEQYFDLVDTFDPDSFDPHRWASLASCAGMRYVTFTTKHHDGFCLFESSHTDFDVTNTPYSRDIVGQVAKAFREADLGVGWYYSAPDMRYQHETGKGTKILETDYEAAFENWTAPYGPLEESFEDFEYGHLEELLTRYGEIDLLFLDGEYADPLKHKAWDIDEEVLVTRAEMDTPELTIEDVPEDTPEPPWEACMTMQRRAWAHKPVFGGNEFHGWKSTNEILDALVEVRAKGGNLLLNIGPKANGELPEEAIDRLRNLAYWNAVTGEAIHGVRPWVVHTEETDHGTIWYTSETHGDTVYAFCRMPWGEGWEGEGRENPEMYPVDLSLTGVRAGAETRVRLLGAPDPLEYQATSDGVDITVDTADQPLFEWFWPRYDWPVAIEITHAEEPDSRE